MVESEQNQLSRYAILTAGNGHGIQPRARGMLPLSNTADLASHNLTTFDMASVGMLPIPASAVSTHAGAAIYPATASRKRSYTNPNKQACAWYSGLCNADFICLLG